MKKKQSTALALVLAVLLAACAATGPAPGGGGGTGAVPGGESRPQSAPKAPAAASAPPQATGVYMPAQRSEAQKNGQFRGVYPRRVYVWAEQELDWALVAERTGLDVAELQKNNPGLEFSPSQKGAQVVIEPEYRCEPDLDEMTYQMWDNNGWPLVDMTAPSALGKENLRLLAQAADIPSFYEVSVGFGPAEVYDRELPEGWELPDGRELPIYQAASGARFTRYSELKAYVESVWAPERARAFLYDPYWGESPAYFSGPEDELPVYYVETSTVELAPTENGMRVAQYARHL